jgi:hypothetical protein
MKKAFAAQRTSDPIHTTTSSVYQNGEQSQCSNNPEQEETEHAEHNRQEN